MRDQPIGIYPEPPYNKRGAQYAFFKSHRFQKRMMGLLLPLLMLMACSQNRSRLLKSQTDMDRIQHQVDQLRQSQEEERQRRQAVLSQIHNLVKSESPIIQERQQIFDQNAAGARRGRKDIQSIPLESLVASSTPTATTAISGIPVSATASQSGRTSDAEALFKNAYSNYNSGEYSRAAEGFLLAYQYADQPDLKAQCLYWIGECHYRNREWKKAVQCFLQLEREFPTHSLLPSALLKKGYAYLSDGDGILGRQTLRTLIEKYPLAEETSLAQERLKELGGF